ncbi:MAG: fasciclin domain-containing protein, partial [Cytophagaceae bacterium]|nr:fasciclin domain-containing protein [Cytophagaceae bacterium]
LAQILLYHVVSGSAASSSLSNGQMITTLNGKKITVTIDGSNVFINDAQVTVVDLPADNGVVHVIDAVMIPPVITVMDVIAESATHTTLEAAILAAELDDDLEGTGPFTVFAPTDAAFNNIPSATLTALLADPTGELAQILLYHVVSGSAASSSLSDGQMITTLNGKKITVTIDGSNVFINDAQVTVVDLPADNGVVHVIDAVMIPPAITVMDVIAESASHTTLETALIAAELDDDLEGTGPFTVFAPTDAAFNNLPSGVLTELLTDPTGDLAQILLYHVVAANAPSSSLSNGQTLTTLNGSTVNVAISGTDVFIGTAQVTIANVAADNGVVHVINAVLIPPTTTSTQRELESQVGVFPNPASASVQVQAPFEINNVELLNPLGQSMRSSSTATLSLEGLESGIYQLRVWNGETAVYKKLSVQP